MPPTLSKAVVDAANAARDNFLRKLDPGAFAPAPPPAAAGPGAGPPPPPGAGAGPPPPPGAAGARGRPARLLHQSLYGDGFFGLLSAFLTQPDKLLATSTGHDDLDFAGWFNYFRDEAKGGGSSTDFGRIFCVFFDLSEAIEVQGSKLALKPGFKAPARLSPEFHRYLLMDPGGVPLGVLSYLLEAGFETFTPVLARNAKMDTDGMAPGEKKTSHFFGPYFDLKSATNTQPTERDTTKEYLLFYRGDNRPPEQVLDHGGAKCRADLDFWRKNANVEQPWHPWKDAARLKKMWVRKGNADNDYFTVNSVGMDFHISCAYPMLKLSEFAPHLTGHIVDWSDAERAQLRATGKADYCLMYNRRNRQTEYVLCDTARVYLCAFKDDTLLSPTYTRNTYPEMGVRTVELDQIIAWFLIRRYHNNDQLRSSGSPATRSKAAYQSPSVGSTMTIHVEKWDWMYSAAGAKNVLALRDPTVFERKLNQFKGKVFEIDHSRLLSVTDTTFDVSTMQKPANVWATVKAPALKR